LPVEYAYVALGHIHQPQCLRGLPHIRYSGSIERLDLGERHEEKGVVLFNVESNSSTAEPICLPLPATPIYDVEIHDPQRELPLLGEQYRDAAQALVRYPVRYRAGVDNLEEVLSELDGIFPRWYDRDWCEAGALEATLSGFEPQTSRKSMPE